jgi:CRP/FNR family transcriptional regulator, cyclic AMP receptor protein
MTDTDIDFSLLIRDGITTRTARAGEIIFQEGDKAEEVFVIKSGQVGIRLGNRTLSELSANTIFGEMALIDAAPRSATAVALTDVELVPISEKQFLFLVGQTPFFALRVMRVLARRLRVSNRSFG